MSPVDRGPLMSQLSYGIVPASIEGYGEREEVSLSSVTVLMLVPNAEDTIERALKSVSWADEIFCVIDARTHDGAKGIAERLATKHAVREYLNAADQRNWALPQIETEWTFVLDADEWVSPELAERLQSLVRSKGGPDGYKVKLMSYFFGRLIKHCGWHRDYKLRLFRTAKGRYPKKRVHSSIKVQGDVGRIDEIMYHQTYNSFEEYFETFHRFTTWSALDMYEAGRKPRVRDVTLRPMFQFIKMYVLRRGFLDGQYGAVLCGLAAFSVFTKYGKLWHLTISDALRPDVSGE